MQTTKLAALTLAGLMSTAVFAAGTSDTDSTTRGDNRYETIDGTTTDDTSRSGMPTNPGMGTGTGSDADTRTGTGSDGTGTGTGGGGMGTGTGGGAGGMGGGAGN